MSADRCSYVGSSACVDLSWAIEASPATPVTEPKQAADHQRIVCERCRNLEEPVEFLIVLVETAREPGADESVLGVVEGPPVALEIQHGALAFGQVNLFCHAHSLPGQGTRYKYPRQTGQLRGGYRLVLMSPDDLLDPSPVASPAAAALAPAPFLIGVAGGTCSGKTTISERLTELAGDDRVALIKLDSYYKPKTRSVHEDRNVTNYDHPDAFDWPLLNDHLAALKAGATVPVPVYDYTRDDRSDQVRLVAPGRIVVVEGILVLYDVPLRERFDLRIFVDADADIRLIRRLTRDVAERGRTAESVIAQYLATVRPSHEQFIEPSKRYADIILPGGGMNVPALDLLHARIRELVQVD